MKPPRLFTPLPSREVLLRWRGDGEGEGRKERRRGGRRGYIGREDGASVCLNFETLKLYSCLSGYKYLQIIQRIQRQPFLKLGAF